MKKKYDKKYIGTFSFSDLQHVLKKIMNSDEE
jgi:hypothetical protein